MLEKRALKDREAASSREADMSMERERQRAVLATQVLHLFALYVERGSEHTHVSHAHIVLALS